jgi:hypothetical protein
MNMLRGTTSILVRAWSVLWPGRSGSMNSIYTVLMLGSLLAGCTTLRPIDVDAVTLHQKIRSGEAVKAGDTIRVITSDGVAHLLSVTAVDENVVMGHPPGAAADVADTVLPVDDIVLVEVSRLSTDNSRTFAAGAGTGTVVVVVLLLIGIISF